MTQLSDLCELIVDCEHKTAPSVASGYPLIRTPNIGVGRLDIEGALRVDEDTYRAWTRRATPALGDLILAREAPVGNVGPVPPGVQPVLGQRTVLIRPFPDKLDPMYLNYLLSGRQLRAWMDGVSSGATVPHLNVADIKAMPLPPLPSLATQRKIAAILSAYDDLIENNERRIKILEEMARRIYREWFVDFRYPGHEEVPLVSSESGLIPRAWNVVTLSALASITMGQSPPSSAYNREGLGLPFHQGVGSYGAHFPVHNVYSTAGTRTADDGDTLVSVRAPVGRINIADRHMILGRGLCGVRAELAPAQFILHALTHFFGEEDVIGGGTIFTSATKRDIEELRLLWPGPALAETFSQDVEPMWAAIRLASATVTNLRMTRDLLLPRLISGDIDVSELNVAMSEAGA